MRAFNRLLSFFGLDGLYVLKEAEMDHRVKTSRELVNHLAYATSLLRGCCESLPRIDIDDADAHLIDHRVNQAVRDLETIRKYFANYMAIWRELKAANESNHDLNAGTDNRPTPAE